MQASNAVSVSDKVTFLRSPEAYRPAPRRVDVIETHWSWVFLADERVFKLKKPVSSQNFDFTALDAREVNCRSEVRLNQRLAGDVYEGVATLNLDLDGNLAINGNGETVDWLVVMRRLPAERMLDRLISLSSFDEPQLEQLASTLAVFYAAQPPCTVTCETYLGNFRREQETNRIVLSGCGGNEKYGATLDRFESAFTAVVPLLEERVQAGRIIDGHGDLRPEHICVNDPIVIFDCLEFSDALRRVDPVDELAFLGLECRMLGADWIGAKLMELVLAKLDQHASGDLIAFYTAFRALLRARLSLAHLLDKHPRDPEKWAPQTARYVAAADAALLSLGF